MSNGCGNGAAYKKVFALVEIVAAMIFCIVEVVGCVRLNGSISDLSESTGEAVNSYITVIVHGKEVFRETYQTIPQHRKTVGEIRKSLISMGESCRRASDTVPGWKWLAGVKELPLDLYKPFGEMEKSLGASLAVLNSLDEKKYNDTIAAFDNTMNSLKDAGKTIPDISGQLAHTISFMTAFMVLLAVLMFCHGLVMLIECRNLTAVGPAGKEK